MRSASTTLFALAFLALLCFASAGPLGSNNKHHHKNSNKRDNQQNFDLTGIWIKHDRAVVESFHLNFTCVANCLPPSASTHTQLKSVAAQGLPQYEVYYLTGPLAGHNTFNITSVGDLMSATGFYNNFADDSGSQACPAPFGLVVEDDTNVVLVSYGATFGTPCGDYTGDSARYYRQSALN